MEKYIISFFRTAGADELSAFDAEFGAIAGSCRSDETEAVLSAALVKAGFGINRSKKRPKLRRLVIAAAAALVLIPSAAVLANRSDRLEQFFGIDDASSPFANEFYQRGGAVTENEDLRLVVDGAFSDELCSYVIVTFSAKNDTGRQLLFDMKHFDDDSYSNEEDKAQIEESLKRQQKAMAPYVNIDDDTSPVHYDYMYNFVFTQQPVSMLKRAERYFDTAPDGTCNICYVKFILSSEDIDTSSPITFTEALSGLSVDIDISAVHENISLTSDDPDCYHNITLSPFAVYIRFDERDQKNPGRLDKLLCKAKFKDGHTEEIDADAVWMAINGDDPEKDRIEAGRWSYSDIRFKSPINTDDFESIEIDGKTYYISGKAENS